MGARTRIICLAAFLAISAGASIIGLGFREAGKADFAVERPLSAAAQSARLKLLDGRERDDWPAYGRTYGEQHYSPLDQINAGTVKQLGLAWYYDLPPGNPLSNPIEVDGKLFTSTGYSVVRAFDAVSGKLLWTFDPEAAAKAGERLRQGWGSRGLAWWNGKIYVGTQDGRLIAIDAATGKALWSSQTTEPGDDRFISGAPRVLDGKVIIGHGGADAARTRGYVTAYDAETGRQLWRFFTVPGDPAKGFEDEAQAMSAKTWSGQWWKNGGGGTVWNAMTYDSETNSVFLGTGNGAPWNYKARSEGKGDNLFLCSIVALDADTGRYKWHYQVNPAENWDYNASQDMQLADMKIGSVRRKVLVQAPKNGFLYVLDRATGELLSADRYAAKITWASHIDPHSGRPVENPAARVPGNARFDMWPSSLGAHSWLPSSLSPQTGYVYIPVIEYGMRYSQVAPFSWKAGNQISGGMNMDAIPGARGSSTLLAWDPASRKPVWRIHTSGLYGGGVLSTGGNLVFQGQTDGKFHAFDARTGKELWSFDAKSPVLAPPISYRVGGRQYVTVITGMGASMGVMNSAISGDRTFDYRQQSRRVLTFALGETARLPEAQAVETGFAEDPDYRENPQSAARGLKVYNHCVVCHGGALMTTGTAPDLRRSAVPPSSEAFSKIVHAGALASVGMPRFQELTERELEDLRQYIRSVAAAARKAGVRPSPVDPQAR